MQPGVVLTKDDAPEIPDPKEQKIYRSFVARIQFVANWLDGFADSNWGNSESRLSTTGLLKLARYNKSIVLWRSRMQKTIALSTAEAQYYSASEIAVEIM
jgi:hypothetical protein